jgi:hypothetical protein
VVLIMPGGWWCVHATTLTHSAGAQQVDDAIKTHLALGSGSVWEHCTYNFEDLKSKLTHYLALC